MPRETLDRQIKEIRDNILVLSSMVEDATIKSIEYLKNRNIENARELFFGDEKINKKRFDIESACLITIATQQPMAHDLRILSSALEVITDLERMGDYAKSIARTTVNTGNEPLLKPLIDVPRMAEIATGMLHRAVEAFVEEDVDQARNIPKDDEEVNALYQQVHRELLTFMLADPRIIDRAESLLRVAQKLERFADRVSNICERTVFVATGEMKEFDAELEASKLEN